MSMLVQQSKRRIPALVGTQVKLTAAFAPSSSITERSNNSTTTKSNTNENNNKTSNVNNSTTQFNPKPPTPPKPTSPLQDPEAFSSSSSSSSPPFLNGDSSTFSNGESVSFPSSSSSPSSNKNRKMDRELMPANMKRISTERIYHGKSFDSRVEALKYLLTSHHFSTLFRAPTTTPKQADLLMEHAQNFGIADSLIFHSYLRFYSRRGNITQVLRTIDRMRTRGIAYSENERLHIERAHRRANIYGSMALRSTVARAWVQIGDVDMCVRCYDAMRSAGTHPGHAGYTALLRIFAEKGETETSARLLQDMETLSVTAHTQTGVNIDNREEVTLGLDTFKSLLRFHAGLAERDVCEKLLEEMRTRGIEADEEVNEIVASIDQQENERERDEESKEIITTEKKRNIQAPKPHHFSRNSNSTTKTNNYNTPQPVFNSFTPSDHANQHAFTQELHNPHFSAPISQHPTIFQHPPISQPPTKTEFEVAMENFEKATEPQSYEIYHSLLKMANNAGDRDACEKLLAAMDAQGISRTQETYAYVIDTMKPNHERCAALFAEMCAHDIKPPRSAYNAMLWIYCAERRVSDAFALFNEMKEEGVADTVAYNTLMRVYAADDNLQSVMGLSNDMKHSGIPHDISTYNIIVGALGKFGLKGLVVVDAVVREMQRNKMQLDVVMYDTLMDIYGSAGQWEKCEEMWKEMRKEGIILGTGSCARFLEKHCRTDPNLYATWKKEFSSFLPP